MAESRAWSILVESFVNEKLLRISKDPLHIHSCVDRLACFPSCWVALFWLAVQKDTTALHCGHQVKLRLCIVRWLLRTWDLDCNGQPDAALCRIVGRECRYLLIRLHMPMLAK
jgi:hypothetical protein